MKKKILILDDKETIAKILHIYLMSEYDCIWLSDGLQGMKWLQEGNTPDLIISDIRMPEMRGDDFLEWLKQNELFKHIPVIMLLLFYKYLFAVDDINAWLCYILDLAACQVIGSL